MSDLENQTEVVNEEVALSAQELLTQERDKLKDQLLRTAADFDNFRKRTRKDIDEVQKKTREDILRELLPVFDNLERAADSANKVTDFKAVVDGVRMVLRLFEDTTQRIGVTRIKTTGERFDPMLHEAVQQVETSEHAPGTILNEVVPGYRSGERLLRAAIVVVAKAPSEGTPSA